MSSDSWAFNVELHLRPLQRRLPISVCDCAFYAHVRDAVQQCLVKGGLNKPSLLHFLNSPLLLLCKSPRTGEIREFEGIWPVQLHPPFFFPWITRDIERGRKQKQVCPLLRISLCARPPQFSPTENTPLFSQWQGAEKREGIRNLLGNKIIAIVCKVVWMQTCAFLMLIDLSGLWLSFVGAYVVKNWCNPLFATPTIKCPTAMSSFGSCKVNTTSYSKLT